jgi:AbrB family looped-hinge helix DNA binding protein
MLAALARLLAGRLRMHRIVTRCPQGVARCDAQASAGADNQDGMIFCMAIPVRHRPHIRTAVLRARGTVTIPQDVRERLDLAEGDQFVITVEEDRIVLTPTSVIPDDQAWFWTPEWQAKEAEADQAAARGERGTVFAGGEEFLAFLDENMKPDR